MYLIVGGVGNGAAEEDWRRDLNPGSAAVPRERTTWLWWSRDPVAVTQLMVPGP